MTDRAASRGFSLIELLVVIAIIAVLAGLLLQGLRLTRETVRTVKCAANLRQTGVFLHQYTMDNEGRFPGGCNPGPNVGGLSWQYILSTEMLADEAVKLPGWGTPGRNSLACPAFVNPPGNYQRGWAMNVNALGGPFNATTKTSLYGLVFDPPSTRSAANASWIYYFLGTRSNLFMRQAAKALVVDIQAARDDVWGLWDMAYRHGGRRSSNVLFVDGHVSGGIPRQNPEYRNIYP